MSDVNDAFARALQAVGLTPTQLAQLSAVLHRESTTEAAASLSVEGASFSPQTGDLPPGVQAGERPSRVQTGE